MDIFAALSMIGGLALFLYGMNAMGNGLTKLSGGKLERILEKLTSKKIMAVLLGVAVTAIIQSSSATTVMVVGFVNSGIMQLEQTVGIIMGANIGTTVTSWILSLAGIDGKNVIIQLLKPSSFSPILAAIGMVLIMTSKEETKKKNIGDILVGFAILMFGMQTMSSAVEPLAKVPAFTSLLTKFSNPVLGMLAGAILTAVIQSSSASVGILQALCTTGAVTYGAAIPIIMGQNIGTCITAIMSSFGANRNAKRASMIHLYFNLIGTAVFMGVFYIINAITPFSFLQQSIGVAGIAIIHSLFNIGCAICWYPFSKYLVKLAKLTIPMKEEREELSEKRYVALDERFLERPAFAIELSRKETIHMAELSRECINCALDHMMSYSKQKSERVFALEDEVDHFEDEIGSYLLKLCNCNLSKEDSLALSIMQHCISDFERITDYAIGIVELREQMQEEALSFSEKAEAELTVFTNAVRKIVDMMVEAFAKNDYDCAKTIEPLEETIDVLNLEIKNRHKKRLRKGKCSVELGLILQEMLMNIERVSDHCWNAALAMIQIHDDTYEMHEYTDLAKEENDPWFQSMFASFRETYCLPAKKEVHF